MDQDEITLEKQRLQIEERRVTVEERQTRQAFWTRMGIIIPVVVALIAFGSDVWVQKKNASDALSLQKEKDKDNFELKAADIVMNAKGPFESRGRAIALREIFVGRLGKQFARKFNPEDATNRKTFERDQRVASKKELLQLIAEHPGEREQIIATWQRLFPDDRWVHALE